MPSQQELEFTKEYSLYEDSDQGGRTKTRNEPPDRIQRQNIHQSNRTDKYKIDVDLYTCIHGTLDQVEKKRASLIVFDFQLVCVDGSGSFRNAQFEFEFEDTDTASRKSGPNVFAYAPFRTEERSYQTSEDVETTKKLELSGGVSAIGEVKGLISGQKKISYQNRYFDRGTGGRYYQSANDRYDGVWWSLNQSKNPHAHDGVRANFRAAVLLTRSSDNEFRGNFRLTVDAGILNKMTRKIEDWRRLTVPDDPINFHPSEPPQGECKGIDSTNLGALAQDDKLKNLTRIPGLEPVVPEPDSDSDSDSD